MVRFTGLSQSAALLLESGQNVEPQRWRRMKRIRKSALLSFGFILLACLLFAYAQSQSQVAQVQPPSGSEEREKLLSTGRKLFVERCARCHDERGDKPLKSGPPLSERKLSDEEIARVVSGRFRDASDEQKRAVTLYISGFVKGK